MKRTLAFIGHLLIATLAVPWLTILAGGLAYGVFSPFLTSVNTPQQFLSDHLMFLVVIVGVLLAYAVSATFTSGAALWVWVPATIVFALRVLDWRAAGSALVGSGTYEPGRSYARSTSDRHHSLRGDFRSRFYR
jgi:hypothetical protein